MPSLDRILAIARNTLTESLRQRVLYVVLLFALVMLGGSNFFTRFTFQEEFKFLKDLAYAAISMTGLLVALMSAAQLIPAEMEKRTIYTVLSKPVRRYEFILGKYLGLMALITLLMVVMSAVFAVVLWSKEVSQVSPILQAAQGHPNEEQWQAIREIRAQAYDPGLLQAAVLLWAKLCVVTALSVLFSTVATSTVFIVCMTLLVYFVGHLQSLAREIWLGRAGPVEWYKKALLGTVSFLVPDFQNYSLIDEVIAGNRIPGAVTLQVLVYTFFYTMVLLALSALIFEDREL